MGASKSAIRVMVRLAWSVSTLLTLIPLLSSLSSFFWLGAVGKQGRHAAHSPAPGRLELVEGLPGAADRAGIGAHELLPPTALLGDQAGPLQHGDVLLHGREAHRVSLRESRNRGLAGGAAAKNVAAGRVRQGMEQFVDRLVSQLIYNHLVV